MNPDLIATLLRTGALLPLLPLVAALGIAAQQLSSGPPRSLAEADHREPPAARLAIGVAALVLVLLLLIDAAAIAAWLDGKPLPTLISLGTWLKIGEHAIPYTLSFDAMSLPVGTIVAFVA
ncbi:MAG TPA: hypothetical protein VFH22_04445, partial [Rhodocyclaceae bacterium]|nr:hypothetical protein [Rhodocyclaceae bacterium]